MAITRGIPNLGPRLSIETNEGELVARLGDEDGPGLEPKKFFALHDFAIDSRGEIYVGKVAYMNWPSRFNEDVPMPKCLRTLQKLEKVA